MPSHKLCMVLNFPAIYRKRIYVSIENTFNTIWNFGENNTDIKEFDTSLLHDVKRWRTRDSGNGIIVMWGLWTLALKKEIGTYLLIGQPSNVSVWLLTLLVRLFRPHCNVYYWCHGFYGTEKGVGKYLKRVFMKLPHGLFLYGNYAKDTMVKMGFNANRLFVIHNSLDYDVQLELRKEVKTTSIYIDHFKNNNPVWIFVGRLTQEKRLDLVLHALSILDKRNENYNLVFVGDGLGKNELQTYVRENGLEAIVWFFGACFDEKTIAELVYNADLCISPGNVGLTAIHMMMFGTPVITHNDFSFQMPEFESVKEGVTGSFFKRDDIDSLVCCITHWFSEKGKAREDVRKRCMDEIDNAWNPAFQMEVLKSVIKTEE